MSAEKKILLVCSSGMSTSMLVKAMQKAATEEGYPAGVSSAGIAGIEDMVKSADAILVGPQIRHRFDALKQICDGAGVPVQLVPTQIYGLMDGKAALKMVKEMMAK